MSKIMKLSIVMMVVLVSTTINVIGQNIDQIGPIKAKLMARNGSVMIDVREKDEVKVLAYDVDGIINIPLSEFATRLSEIPKDKDVILACRSGNRSGRAAKILVNNGYTKVYNLEGGIKGWQAKKLDVIVDGKIAKKACCAKPNSKDCKPDGTCKKPAKKAAEKPAKKACCSKGKKSCSKSKK